MSCARRLYHAADSIRRRIAPRRTDRLSVSGLLRQILAGERLVAVDVGAANGILPHWTLLDGVAELYQVEPREDACRELERQNEAAGLAASRHVVCGGVAVTEGPRTLYVSNVPTGTSILPFEVKAAVDCADYVDQNYLFPITEQTILTRRLSSIMNDAGERHADLIKLDIQGAELEALQGLGEERLSSLLSAELEVGMHSFYPAEARFPAIEQFMNDSGFELFDVRVARTRRPLNGEHGGYETKVFNVEANSPTIAARLWEFDAVYFRKKSVLLERGDCGELRRMAVVYAVYNYYSEAHSLIDKAEKAGVFDRTAADELKQSIVDLHHVATYRPWLANTPFWNRIRSVGTRFAPRNAPRWCQHMYQEYPNG